MYGVLVEAKEVDKPSIHHSSAPYSATPNYLSKAFSLYSRVIDSAS